MGGGYKGGDFGNRFARNGMPGDWHCSNSECKNHVDNVVYASKDACPLCGTPKAMIGTRHSAKKHDGDWQCPNPSCKNHTNYVYASKATCTICGTPNPGPMGMEERPRSRSPRAGHGFYS